MHEVTVAEVVVIENVSEDEDGAIKEDGNEVVLYNYLLSNNARGPCLLSIGSRNMSSKP